MGMSSSRRYEMQEITLVTTSNASNWKVNGAKSTGVIKYHARGNTYRQEANTEYNTPTIDLSANAGSETVVVESSRGITKLNCYSNKLKQLDVSKNVSLTYLSCISNPLLATLNVTKNVLLTDLICYSNKLKQLDVSKNVSLIVLSCLDNNLETLNVSKNTRLVKLYCHHLPNIRELDVSKNVSLIHLHCEESPNLATIYVNQNQLDILNGVIAKPQYWDWRKDPTATYVLKQ
ncbi:hypothetical protein AUW17_02895 [Tenacibaculum dicentrarchi]|nr:hypothetical protein AUW17_02895 [Tenacibaculum dicentrarchi]